MQYESRARSVNLGDNAQEFLVWLASIMASLTDEQQKNATVVLHLLDQEQESVMLGFQWGDVPPLVAKNK